jgi:hypothetical protein
MCLGDVQHPPSQNSAAMTTTTLQFLMLPVLEKSQRPQSHSKNLPHEFNPRVAD